MVDQIEVVTFTTPAAPGTLDITHPGITEPFSAAILIFTKETADDTDGTHAVLGYGVIGIEGTDEEEACLSVQMRDGEASVPDANTVHSAATAPDCVRVPDGSNAAVTVIAAQYSASIAGGVRINFSTTTVQAKCTAILFAGSARVAVGAVAASTIGAAESVGSAGNEFRPDLLVFLPSDGGTNSNTVDATMALGFVLDQPGTPQISAFSNVDDGTEPTDADAAIDSTRGYVILGPARARQFVSIAITATGFTATSTVGTPDAAYLAIKWADSARVHVGVANMAVAASTGVQAFNSFGFTPDVVFGMATLLTSLDTLVDGPTAAVSGLFAFGRGGYQRAYAVRYDEGLTVPADGTTHATSRQGDHALLMMDDTGTVVQQASYLGASGSGGFLLNFSTASAAGYMTALGIQIIPSPPLPARRQRALRRGRGRRGPVGHGLHLRVGRPVLHDRRRQPTLRREAGRDDPDR